MESNMKRKMDDFRFKYSGGKIRSKRNSKQSIVTFCFGLFKVTLFNYNILFYSSDKPKMAIVFFPVMKNGR